MIQDYLLSILIFLPILAAVVILAWPDEKGSLFRWIALIVCLLQLALIMVMICGPESSKITALNDTRHFQWTERVSWINMDLGSFGKLSAEYFLGTDGLNITLVLLTSVIMLISTISSWSVINKRKGYFTLLLILNGAIMGCFLSLDFLLFYLFFEFMLLPMFFLIGLWGGPRKDYAAIKFFLYTLLGSILLLIVMIGLYSSFVNPSAIAVELGMTQHIELVDQSMISEVHKQLADGSLPPERIIHTFNMVNMADPANIIPGSILDSNSSITFLGWSFRYWAFFLLFLGFAIKIPVVPLHTWLPDAHVEAPTPISVILAGVLLKIGAYGLMRTAYLIFPDGAWHFSWLVALAGVISIIYGALNALASNDLKRLVAYSSVSHMGFVLLGLASNTNEGLHGAIFQLVSHGIISAALFILAGVLSDRTHDRLIRNYSGLAGKMPKYTVLTVLFFFASLGLPGMSGFIAEVLVILGAFASENVNGLVTRGMAIISILGLILAAAYYLWTLQRMFFGSFYYRGDQTANLKDLTIREYLMLVPLAAMTLILGIFPSIILNMISASVNSFVELVGAGITDKLPGVL